jgi:hypothetical protein
MYVCFVLIKASREVGDRIVTREALFTSLKRDAERCFFLVVSLCLNSMCNRVY